MHAGKLIVRQTKQQTDGQTYTQISNSPMHTDPSRLMVSAATGYAAGHDVIHGCVQGCLVQREAFADCQNRTSYKEPLRTVHT